MHLFPSNHGAWPVTPCYALFSTDSGVYTSEKFCGELMVWLKSQKEALMIDRGGDIVDGSFAAYCKGSEAFSGIYEGAFADGAGWLASNFEAGVGR